MPISVKCGDCGKGLKAPDALAGKKAKCPQCGSVIPIPAAVSDAEEYDDDDPPAARPSASKAMARVAKTPVDDEDEENYDDETEESEDGRKPCPMCGEMIIATAAKCRFCGEVFDSKAGKLGGRSKRKGGKLDSSDRELLQSFRRHAQWTGGFMIFISIIVGFAGIGLLAGGRMAQQQQGFGQPPGMGQPQQIPQMMGVMGVVFIGLAAIWFTLGVFVCRKHLWAAYVTTGMSGLSLLGNLMTKNIPGACGAGAILAESIIIGQKGRELNRRGIPLNSRP